MKTDRNFMQLLRDNGLFTFEHPFEGQSLERIGFFSELYHKTMHMNDFQHKVQQELTKAIANHQEYHFVPPFAINANITRHREVYNGQSIYHNTEAFEVECAPSDAAALVKILCLADLPLRQFGTFIPFSIIREDPELLIQKIADNNHLKTIMTTLYLNGWHTKCNARQHRGEYNHPTGINEPNRIMYRINRTDLQHRHRRTMGHHSTNYGTKSRTKLRQQRTYPSHHGTQKLRNIQKHKQ